jgi:hypothetical protein
VVRTPPKASKGTESPVLHSLSKRGTGSVLDLRLFYVWRGFSECGLHVLGNQAGILLKSEIENTHVSFFCDLPQQPSG